MGIRFYKNERGPVIGTAECGIIEQDGYFFRDLEGTGELLPYEDWRLDAESRAMDLASRMTIKEIAGLMMYSPHQMVPGISFGPFHYTYEGKPFEESGMAPWMLNDQQKKLVSEDGIRHVLLMRFSDVETVVKWNNEMQKFAESLPHGIPIAFSSDPRHGAGASAMEFKTEASDVSKWPEGLGMAATFDSNICEKFGEVVAKEYRALGITVALHPQVDLGTEPRWLRVEDTFGVHPQLVTEFGRAYCDGLQTTKNSLTGWGTDSVCAMAKHWPGGGPCEGGRDAHYAFGKYAVYPGNAFAEHLKPFTEGVFKLDGPTEKVASIMPYYSVSWDVDQEERENVGNSYSHYMIHNLLREKYGYDGVVCTDWGITGDQGADVDEFGSRCFGVENLTEAERHLRIIENGVDQFGGNSDIVPILKAYELGCEKYGEEWMRARFEQSAKRLLKNMFQCGLFENPYLKEEESIETVGCKEFCEEGFAAQLKSIVMLKNNGVLPIKERIKVYVPKRSIKAKKNFFRMMDEAKVVPGASREVLEQYFQWTEKIEDADAAIVFVESPISDGYSVEDREKGGNGYVPLMLQYRPYTAQEARECSIAGGDPREAFLNRSYRGKTNTAANEADLDLIIDAKQKMGDKPVIAVIRMHHPMVMSELEPYADAILVDFGVTQKAICELITGKVAPQGLLPVQLPMDMATVESHCEDKPLDLKVYKDLAGNSYDFGYGLNWNGVIKDERTEKYKVATNTMTLKSSCIERFAPATEALRLLAADKSKERILVAIDGNCASGKSTLGQYLKNEFDANLFHMDDFFLQSHQRTKERFAEVGGNVDYERFKEEVLDALIAGKTVDYRIFDCSTLEITESKKIEPKRINIIEGSYSHHPYFGNPYGLLIFTEIDSENQLHNIRKRNGEEKLKNFVEKWIPKEEAYFAKFDIKEKCDVVINWICK